MPAGRMSLDLFPNLVGRFPPFPFPPIYIYPPLFLVLFLTPPLKPGRGSAVCVFQQREIAIMMSEKRLVLSRIRTYH